MPTSVGYLNPRSGESTGFISPDHHAIGLRRIRFGWRLSRMAMSAINEPLNDTISPSVSIRLSFGQLPDVL